MSSAAQANQLQPSTSARIDIPGFRGGVNNASAPDELQDDEVRGIENIILDENGGGSKRLGITTISNPGADILSLYVFYRGATLSPQVLVHLANGNFRYSNDNGQTWSAPRIAAATADASDHPLLVAHGERVFLSWQTRADGYRFMALEDAR